MALTSQTGYTNTPEHAKRASTAPLGPSNDARTGVHRRASAASWAKALRTCLALQKTDNWADYLMPEGRAMSLIELLAHDGRHPFIVLNGLTDHTYVWLWLSPEAVTYVTKTEPWLLARTVAVTHGYYITIRKPETKAAEIAQALSILESDCAAAIRRIKEPVQPGILVEYK
jgi:hypothetical protein